MPGVTHLTAESPPSTIEYALKSAGMLALVILLKFGAHLSDPALSFNCRQANHCIAIHYFFSSLHYPVRICVGTVAFLPRYAAFIAEFGFTTTPVRVL